MNKLVCIVDYKIDIIYIVMPLNLCIVDDKIGWVDA